MARGGAAPLLRDEEAAEAPSSGGERPRSASEAPSPLLKTCCVAICLVAALGAAFVGWRRWPASEHRLQSSPRAEVLQAEELTDKPQSDARTYSAATLPNGLEVLAVQDARSRSTAFAVAVRVGSFDDPAELPGLSHFCEHMLFLGTERFPEPQGFDAFVAANGGAQNAYTASEATIYYVQLSQAGGAEGLERFADFFRAPLFNSTFVGKEVHAIDSEHAKNVQDPTRRVYAVMESLADPGSAVGHFATGNIDTLYRLPTERGLDPMAALRRHFASNYCPARMSLVTFGPSPTGEQLHAAARTFGRIPAAGGLAGPGMPACSASAPSHAKPPAWPAQRLGKWVDIEGTTPDASLWVGFSLPDVRQNYSGQPLDHLVWVLGYQGESSLFQLLRDGLGLAFSVGATAEPTSAGTTLWLTLGLTEAGRGRPDLVLDVLFAYIALLRHGGAGAGLQRSIAEAGRLEWEWAEPKSPTKTVEDLAERMTRLPIKDLLWGDEVARRPDPGLVATLLDRLSPALVNVGLVDPLALAAEGAPARGAVPGPPRAVETLAYYGVRYAVRDLEEAFPGATARWLGWARQATATVEAELAERLRQAGLAVGAATLPRLPTAIAGLPREADIVLRHATAGPAAVLGSPAAQGQVRQGIGEQLFGQPPNRLDWSGLALAGADAGGVEIWYREGWRSNAPKHSPAVSLTVALRRLPPEGGPEPTAHDAARVLMYSRLLGEEIDTRLADTSVAGGVWSVSASLGGLQFAFGGFQPLLRGEVSKVMSEFSRHATLPTAATRYKRVARQLREELRGYSGMPVTYAVSDRNLLLTKGEHSREDLVQALQQIGAQSAAAALEEVLLGHPVQLTALAMGNLEDGEAVEGVQAVVRGLPHFGGPAAGAPWGRVERVTPIVALGRPVEVRKRNPRQGDPNDAIVVSLVVGVSTVENRVVLGLLGQILGRVAYGELRTSMQLGYVVNAGQVQLSNVQLLSCVVQGAVLGADDLEGAVERVFTSVMPERLARFTEQEFAAYKRSFADGLLQEPFHTADEVAHFWGPIALGGACLGLHDEMLRYLNASVTRELLVREWESLAMPKQGIRRKLVVKYFAGGGDPPGRALVEESARAWAKQGIGGEALGLLRREHGETLVLQGADAAARARVLEREGGRYFPADVICSLPAGAALVASADDHRVPAARRHGGDGGGGRSGQLAPGLD